MIITSLEQVIDLQQTILNNAEKVKEILEKSVANMSAVQLFAAIKFDKIGADPITGQKLNIIEQINQMYSDLVILDAVQNLMVAYPEKTFELHVGSSAGYDVASTDGQVVAECFAVTGISSNDKLNKDCRKLLKSKAEHKFLFFYSHCDDDTVLQRKYEKYPEIHFRRIVEWVEKSPDS